jgi:hypothetical protein
MTPSEKTLTCAREAVQLWAVCKNFIETVGAAPEISQTTINQFVAAAIMARPVRSEFHHEDLTTGPRGKANARAQRARMRRANPPMPAELIKLMFIELGDGTAKLFESFKETIVERVHAHPAPDAAFFQQLAKEFA